MKKLFSFFLILFTAANLNAQWVFQSFDNAVHPNTTVGTNWADTAIHNTNFYTNGPTSYMNLTNDSDFMEGTGSMKISYRVEAFDGWGGYNVRTNYHEATISELPYIDLSAGTSLSFWYKVVTPADTSQGGAVTMEFKLAEFDNDNNRDVFFHQPVIDFFDPSGEWHQVIMPLNQTETNTTGFSLQFGDGDQDLQYWNIKGFEIALVYITSGNSDNPPSVTGEILIDKFELIGNRYEPPIFTFDNSAASWNLDWMDWAGDDKGAIAVSDEAADTVEGEGSLKIDYTLSAPYVWGGFLSLDQDVTAPEKFEERTAITLFVKNLTPAVADSGRVFLRTFVMENSSGSANEEWINDAGLDFSQPFDWTRVYLPLKAKTMGVNDRFPPKDGFALKNGAGDGSFNPEAITKIRIELFGRGTEDGYTDPLKTDGSILLDFMQQSGFQFADHEAPAAPQVAVVQGSYSNLVTWTDIEGEIDEKYYVFASDKPITKVPDSGVEIIGSGIPGDVQVVEHPIRSAKVDKEKTYYYAVYCKDYAGNIGPATFTEGITNTAKGIPVVSASTPVFVADGDLAEWSAIQPFSIKISDGSAHVVTNDKADSDEDISADCYVAIDENYLYVAFDVTDDIVYHDPLLESWNNDSPDLFIGLYDFDTSHVAYQHGSKPDYHFRFGKFLARNDHWDLETDSLLIAGTENYYWGEKFPSGYIIEARLALTDLETRRDNATAPLDTINWQKGFRVPFDFGINDNDGSTREGRIFYSSLNNDDGYWNVSHWAYTWIDDEIVGVEENPILGNKFSLGQNYPNPFNPSTKISYYIEKPDFVKLKIYDMLGRQITVLVNEQQSAGYYSINFNASNLASGLYFYSIESGSFKATKKMMLLK